MEEGTPLAAPSIIGRREEMEILKDHLNDALQSRGSTVFISGEAGIGKTKIVDELKHLAEENDTKILEGRCLADNLEPLLPFKEALRNADLLHLISQDPPPKVISAYLITASGLLIAKTERQKTELDADIFASMLSAVQNFVKDSLSFMGEEKDSSLNSIAYGGHDIIIQTVGDLSLAMVIEGSSSEFLIDDMRKTLYDIKDELGPWDGEVSSVKRFQKDLDWFIDSGKYEGKYLVDDSDIKKENLFDNVLLGLKRSSTERPVLLFLDDLQWSDHTTLSLLHYLSRNTRDNRLMIVGTYRPEDLLKIKENESHPLKTTMQNMSRESLFQEIEVERFSRGQTEKFVDDMLEGVNIDKRFTDKIHNESGGNPYFIFEMMKLLVDEGHIKRDQDGWTIEKDVEDLQIPSKIYDIVVRRLDRLIKEQKDILECASIIGDEFESEVLGDITGINRLKLLRNLNKIEKTHKLIHSLEKKYRFDHHLVKDVLYDGMMEELRKEYHKITAETYGSLFDPDELEVKEKIAKHFFKAGDGRAGRHLVDLGESSKENFSNQDAAEYFQRALGCADKSEIKRRAHEGLGDIYSTIGEFEDAIEHYSSALELTEGKPKKTHIINQLASVYDKKGDHEQGNSICEGWLEKIEEDMFIPKVELMGTYGWNHLVLGDYERSEKILKEALSLAGKLGDDDTTAEMEHILGTYFSDVNKPEKAIKHLKSALEKRDGLEDQKGLSASLNNLAIVYWEIGRLEEALELTERSIEISEMIGSKYNVANSLNNLGLIYYDLANLDSSLEYLQKALDLSEQIGEKRGISRARGNLGYVHREKGDLKRAVEHHKAGLRIDEEIGNKPDVCYSLDNLGMSYLYSGELDKAEDHFQKSIAIAEEIGDTHQSILINRGLGELMLRRDDLDEALEYASKADEMCEDIDMRMERGECKKLIGDVYQKKGEQEKAKSYLEEALQIFQKTKDDINLSKTHFGLGELFEEIDDIQKAKEHYDRAFEMFDRIGMKLWKERAIEALDKLDG
ncbi:MAG: tetratricopeptide repeat protein [Thermoplasmatota archaeon]